MRVERPAIDISTTTTPGGHCPACGEPLFAWIEAPDADPRSQARYLIDRCEGCGLALERGQGSKAVATLIERLDREVAERGVAILEVPNAASFQAVLGTESWSGLRLPDEPALLTPRALELLLDHAGLEPVELGNRVRPGIAGMFETILNLLTFNRDFARLALTRALRPRQSRAGAAGFAIDVLVTAFTAIPVAVVAVLFEGGALLAHRGGVLSATIRRR